MKYSETLKDGLLTIAVQSHDRETYRTTLGYTSLDLNELLLRKNITYEEFSEVAEVNTGIEVDGEYLMYKHDVDRFLSVIESQTPTYFD